MARIDWQNVIVPRIAEIVNDYPYAPATGILTPGLTYATAEPQRYEQDN